MEKASTGVAETAADVEIDARLRDDLRVDILKLKGLLGENVSLDKVKMYQYINECAVVAQKTAIVQVALECADTDGTGSKLNCSMTLQRLSRDLLADMDAEHVAAVRSVHQPALTSHLSHLHCLAHTHTPHLHTRMSTEGCTDMACLLPAGLQARR